MRSQTTKSVCGSCVDRISSLPDNLQECILSKLPIGDAARTSLLSWKWRYKWLSLSNLIYDDTFFRFVTKNREDTISKILLTHDGPVTVFSLSTRYFVFNRVDIDTWIMHLWSKGVKDLTLEFGIWGDQPYRLHSRLFSFPSLCSLVLCQCVIQLPSIFTGFKYLTTMSLSSVTIATDAFEGLIAKCSVLTDLELSDVHGLDRVNVSAPKIKNFTYFGEFRKICFKICMPKKMTIEYSYLPEKSLVEFPIEAPSLSTEHQFLELEAGLHFMKILVVAASHPSMLEFLFKNLERLYLSDFPFDDIEAVSCSLQLISVLRKLRVLLVNVSSRFLLVNRWIDCDSESELFMEDGAELIEKESSKLDFLELRRVTITSILGDNPEMEFMKMLLAKSPLLETMTLKVDEYVDDKNILTDLLSFPRASTRAQIILSQAENSILTSR